MSADSVGSKDKEKSLALNLKRRRRRKAGGRDGLREEGNGTGHKPSLYSRTNQILKKGGGREGRKGGVNGIDEKGG